MFSINVLKQKSIPLTTNAIIMEADNTTTALFASSERDGHDTLCTSSS
jgi:hypothetical protein|nr:hypothetical protein [Bacteroides propionicifaciens]